jgi:cytosine/adenosine deaminase-related metal-dependent hydrolase
VGLGDVVGSLTPGKRADVVVVSPDGIRGRPGADPVATLISYSGPGDVDTVVIDGEFRKRGGALVGVDIAALAQRCARSAAVIRERAATLPTAVIDGAWQGMF